MQKPDIKQRSVTVNSYSIRKRVERLAKMERRGASQMAALLLSDQLDVVEKKLELAPIEPVTT